MAINNKDTRFELDIFRQEPNPGQYNNIKSNIDRNGFVIIDTGDDKIKVYTPELFYVFITDKLPVTNLDTKKATVINGKDYCDSYIKGYKEGEQYFQNNYWVSANTLYGANAEQFILEIHNQYFHNRHEGYIIGWGMVKKHYPAILTHREVKIFGFYSGLVNKLEELIKNNSKVFKKFDKCEHSLTSQQNETKTNKLKVKQIALIHFYEGKRITRKNAGEIAAEHGYTAKNSGEGLFQDYTNYCSTANRKGKPTPCTPIKLKNKIELFESVISYLSDSNKQRVIDEIRILKTIFENEYQ